MILQNQFPTGHTRPGSGYGYPREGVDETVILPDWEKWLREEIDNIYEQPGVGTRRSLASLWCAFEGIQAIIRWHRIYMSELYQCVDELVRDLHPDKGWLTSTHGQMNLGGF